RASSPSLGRRRQFRPGEEALWLPARRAGRGRSRRRRGHDGAVSMSTPIEQLLAIEEIKRVFAGRLRCMDTKDWDRYATFHTEDVVSDSWNSPGAAQPAGGPAGTAAPGRRAGAPVVGPAALTE